MAQYTDYTLKKLWWQICKTLLLRQVGLIGNVKLHVHLSINFCPHAKSAKLNSMPKFVDLQRGGVPSKAHQRRQQSWCKKYIKTPVVRGVRKP